MVNFKFKLKVLFRIIAICILSVNSLAAGEHVIDNFITNYSRSISVMPTDVQIRLTNYLLVVNTLESIAENRQVERTLNKLIRTSDSKSVRYHAKIVKIALSNNQSEILNYRGKNHKANDSKEKIEYSLLIFLEYINQNMFNYK